jgi:hypothetical protein
MNIKKKSVALAALAASAICTTGVAQAATVNLTPSQNLASAVAAAPNGTTFVLANGTYNSGTVKPKAGQTIQAADPRGATVNGGGGDVIFSTASDVSLDGVKVTGGTDGVKLLGANATISNVEVFGNARKGLVVHGDGSRVTDSYIHHNGVYGINSIRGTNQVWDELEVSHNRLNGACDGASGAMKFVYTRNVTLRNSNFHDNGCNGIWYDISNVGGVIENNRSINNDGSGIIYEISYSGKILGNTSTDNTKAGIIVRSSPDVEIAYNTVRGNSLNSGTGDLVLYGANRTDHREPGLPAHLTRGNYVHHNTVLGSKFGVINTGDPQPSALFDAESNRFVSNTWDIPSASSRAFKWNGQSLTFAQWRAVGQDGDLAARAL